jgi:hypothetical protein
MTSTKRYPKRSQWQTASGDASAAVVRIGAVVRRPAAVCVAGERSASTEDDVRQFSQSADSVAGLREVVCLRKVVFDNHALDAGRSG